MIFVKSFILNNYKKSGTSVPDFFYDTKKPALGAGKC